MSHPSSSRSSNKNNCHTDRGLHTHYCIQFLRYCRPTCQAGVDGPREVTLLTGVSVLTSGRAAELTSASRHLSPSTPHLVRQTHWHLLQHHEPPQNAATKETAIVLAHASAAARPVLAADRSSFLLACIWKFKKITFAACTGPNNHKAR